MEGFDQAEPVTVLRYPGYGLGWFRFFPMLYATWPHVRHTDLILGINVAYGGAIGYWAFRRHGTPYVAFAYAYEFLKFRTWSWVAAWLRTIYRDACVTVAISSYTSEHLAAFGVPPERLRTIFPGAPRTQPWQPEALAALRHKYVLDERRVILAVGRFIPRKGHLTLVRAMPRVLDRFPNAHLALVGRGPCLPDVVNEAHRLGLQEHVSFPGRLSDEDIAGLYQVCEVFALPTGRDRHGQVEGFGLVFTEAHAYGKPVVAGRSGGVADAVIDGETGLLVEPNQPEALADAITALMADPARAQRLGENGRRRVDLELNWTRFTRRMLDAVESGR
jgi:phosphatidylinositol alpha-1,6-mannosyltransferase